MDATELCFAGAARQAELIRAGDVSAREVVQAHLDRIARLDPQLRAFRVVLAEQALAEADAVDQHSGRTTSERPLNGVPVAIKDDVDVAGEVTAWGTRAHGPAKTADGEVVRRLREAGAIVLGKTAVPEMTIWPFTESQTFGVTRNPWDLERTPGGSSGGTAAAVAAGLAPLGLGSDGGGSIRIPSAWCGLFGIKPQRDRVPLGPHDDAWQGLSVNGPLARRVVDAALFLDATTTLPGPEGGFAEVARRADPGRLRIAVSTKVPPGVLARIGREQRAALEGMAQTLRGLGHEVVERDPDWPGSTLVMTLTRYLRGIADDVSSMPHPERLERRTRGMARLGSFVSAARVAKVRAGEAAAVAQFSAIFDDVDVLLQPGPVVPPPPVGRYEGRGAVWTLNGVAQQVPFQPPVNVFGLPAASLPAGLDAAGLPIGVQATVRAEGEATLVALGAQLEAVLGWADRRPPVA